MDFYYLKGHLHPIHFIDENLNWYSFFMKGNLVISLNQIKYINLHIYGQLTYDKGANNI